ncbi:MAG TPA: ATP-grasp domain-containing protein [Fulvivirga sp.]|nr:ATP-grasp domain-containing protein [Fulvivirga sp.]
MITVLRTAAGSPVAPFIIKELKNIGCRVIAADIDRYSCGFPFADKSYSVSTVRSDSYLNEILDICLKEKVDIFFPDLDEELLLMARNHSKFEKIGTKLLLSELGQIEICVDKWKTYNFLRECEVPVPYSWDLDVSQDIDKFPLLLKPKYGRGSKGIVKIIDPTELKNFNISGYIAQEFLEGTEYTIDVLSDFKGNYLYSSIRERMATDSGISVKGRTIENSEITGYVKTACNVLKLKGPTCFQCIVTFTGKIGFIEINPRIAGTVALSVMAGAPIVSDSIKTAMNEKVEKPINYHFNVVMARYWEEVKLDVL